MRVRILLPLVPLALAFGSGVPAAQSDALFSFHSNAWLNLHHFIRAAARGGPAPTGLLDEERSAWTAGVDFYRPYASRDVLRDDGMVAIKNGLRLAERRANLDGIAIGADLKATLERVMPIYRKHWWPAHDRANREWIAAVGLLLDRHGAALSQAVARVYGVRWPTQSVPVDLSVIAGPVGAYTTCEPTHATISSQDTSYRGLAALEMVFHESSHCLSQLFQRVNQAAAERKVSVPPQLWHGVLFYTAGELTTRELKAHGIDYAQYAGSDLYANLCGAGCRERIAEHWTPRLDGTRTVAEALSALVLTFK
jgi:hypothetical protein